MSKRYYVYSDSQEGETILESEFDSYEKAVAYARNSTNEGYTTYLCDMTTDRYIDRDIWKSN